jgi:hypothetical protein
MYIELPYMERAERPHHLHPAVAALASATDGNLVRFAGL